MTDDEAVFDGPAEADPVGLVDRVRVTVAVREAILAVAEADAADGVTGAVALPLHVAWDADAVPDGREETVTFDEREVVTVADDDALADTEAPVVALEVTVKDIE